MRKLLRDMLDQLDAFGKLWLVLGLASLAAAAAMSFDFGWQVSTKHALFLAILTVVAAFGPMAAEMLWGKGRRGPAIACAVICVPLLGIEFYSHAGYTAGLRGYNIETLTVAPTEDASLSRMTIVSVGSDDVIEQITKHLNRLIEVVKVVDLTEGAYIERELMMVKVRAVGKEREERITMEMKVVTNYENNQWLLQITEITRGPAKESELHGNGG